MEAPISPRNFCSSCRGNSATLRKCDSTTAAPMQAAPLALVVSASMHGQVLRRNSSTSSIDIRVAVFGATDLKSVFAYADRYGITVVNSRSMACATRLTTGLKSTVAVPYSRGSGR